MDSKSVLIAGLLVTGIIAGRKIIALTSLSFSIEGFPSFRYGNGSLIVTVPVGVTNGYTAAVNVQGIALALSKDGQGIGPIQSTKAFSLFPNYKTIVPVDFAIAISLAAQSVIQSLVSKTGYVIAIDGKLYTEVGTFPINVTKKVF